MENLRLTEVRGLSVPVELSNYRADGAKLYESEVGEHYTILPLPNGNVAYHKVEENADDPADSDPIYSENVEIVVQYMVG